MNAQKVLGKKAENPNSGPYITLPPIERRVYEIMSDGQKRTAKAVADRMEKEGYSAATVKAQVNQSGSEKNPKAFLVKVADSKGHLYTPFQYQMILNAPKPEGDTPYRTITRMTKQKREELEYRERKEELRREEDRIRQLALEQANKTPSTQPVGLNRSLETELARVSLFENRGPLPAESPSSPAPVGKADAVPVNVPHTGIQIVVRGQVMTVKEAYDIWQDLNTIFGPRG